MPEDCHKLLAQQTYRLGYICGLFGIPADLPDKELFTKFTLLKAEIARTRHGLRRIVREPEHSNAIAANLLCQLAADSVEVVSSAGGVTDCRVTAQTEEEALQILRYGDPSKGVPLPGYPFSQ